MPGPKVITISGFPCTAFTFAFVYKIVSSCKFFKQLFRQSPNKKNANPNYKYTEKHSIKLMNKKAACKLLTKL